MGEGASAVARDPQVAAVDVARARRGEEHFAQGTGGLDARLRGPGCRRRVGGAERVHLRPRLAVVGGAHEGGARRAGAVALPEAEEGVVTCVGHRPEDELLIDRRDGLLAFDLRGATGRRGLSLLGIGDGLPLRDAGGREGVAHDGPRADEAEPDGAEGCQLGDPRTLRCETAQPAGHAAFTRGGARGLLARRCHGKRVSSRAPSPTTPRLYRIRSTADAAACSRSAPVLASASSRSV